MEELVVQEISIKHSEECTCNNGKYEYDCGWGKKIMRTCELRLVDTFILNLTPHHFILPDCQRELSERCEVVGSYGLLKKGFEWLFPNEEFWLLKGAIGSLALNNDKFTFWETVSEMSFGRTLYHKLNYEYLKNARSHLDRNSIREGTKDKVFYLIEDNLDRLKKDGWLAKRNYHEVSTADLNKLVDKFSKQLNSK